MKILTGIILVFAFLAVGELNAEVRKEGGAGLGVVAVHDLKLKTGINEKDFESFIVNEWLPLYSKIKGLDTFLAKGDRGIRAGEYSLILTFESIEDRNRIYPPSGETSEEISKIQDDINSAWEKFEPMSEGLGETFTDYVRIGNVH
jgi:hypothetical protein